MDALLVPAHAQRVEVPVIVGEEQARPQQGGQRSGRVIPRALVTGLHSPRVSLLQ